MKRMIPFLLLRRGCFTLYLCTIIIFPILLLAKNNDLPKIVSDKGPISQVSEWNYIFLTNGQIIAVEIYTYVKNIGGDGVVDVQFKADTYVKNTQFLFKHNYRYKLFCHYGVTYITSSYYYNYRITFPGTDGDTIITSFSSQIHISPPLFTAYVPNSIGSTALICWDSTTTNVEKTPTNTPTEFVLQQNYPNPFNPTTTFSFTIPIHSYVTLNIYDLLGRKVTTIVSEVMFSGNHSLQWDAFNIPSGVYFYRLQAGSFTETKKLVLLR